MGPRNKFRRASYRVFSFAQGNRNNATGGAANRVACHWKIRVPRRVARLFVRASRRSAKVQDINSRVRKL